MNYHEVKLPAEQIVQRAKRDPAPAEIRVLPGAAGPRSGDEALVRFENVAFGYESDVEILHGIDLEIKSGDVIAVLGPNGAGKTTFVKHAIGLLKPEIRARARERQGYERFERGRNCQHAGLCFPESQPHALCARPCARNWRSVRRILKHPKAEIEKEVKEALRIVNLSDKEQDPPLALSFGQQKRVSIAAILAMRSRILVMDEPTAGQDYQNYMNFMDAILQLPGFEAVMFITHDVDLAVIYANRVLLVADGRLVADGSPHEVLRDFPRLEACRVVPSSLLALNVARISRKQGRFLRAEALAHVVIVFIQIFQKENEMDKRLSSVLIWLVAIFAIFAVIMFVLGNMLGIERFQTDNATLGLRFAFVVLGLLIAFAVYFFSKDNKAWEVGTREVVWMAIGAALYAVFSWYFNATVFVVPSLSQVALRPAIAIPMFFGYAFGPIVGFFTGAVGNMFGDAITGFGLSPQWSIGNGLVGFIAGLPALFANRKKSHDTVLWMGGVLAVLATVAFFLNRDETNMMFFDPANNSSATTHLLVRRHRHPGRFILVLIVRFAFGTNLDVAAAVIWGMLGNILGIGFAAISDIWINGFSPAAAIVGEFLPAAGPNLIFAAILVPLLVAAYAAVQKQSGR